MESNGGEYNYHIKNNNNNAFNNNHNQSELRSAPIEYCFPLISNNVCIEREVVCCCAVEPAVDIQMWDPTRLPESEVTRYLHQCYQIRQQQLNSKTMLESYSESDDNIYEDEVVCYRIQLIVLVAVSSDIN